MATDTYDKPPLTHSQRLHTEEEPSETTQQLLSSQPKRASALKSTTQRKCPLCGSISEHTQRTESVLSHRPVLQANRRIPTEILHQIFLECIRILRSPAMDPMSPPLSFTQVCRVWRAAALNIPELWTSIRIINHSADRHSQNKIRSYVEQVKRWLSRAGRKPVEITFYSASFDFTSEVEYLLPKAILNHSSSIQKLHLKVSESLLRVIVGGEMRYRRSWPVLETITVDLGEDGNANQGVGWISDLHNPIWEAPKLKNVVWKGVDADVLRLSLNWEQLEELQLSGRHLDRVNWVWRRCAYGEANVSLMLRTTRKLVKLQISTDRSNEHLPDGWFGGKVRARGLQEAVTTLPHLTTLDLLEVPSRSNSSVLDNLQLPALHTLTYELVSRGRQFPPTDHHPLVNFLRSQRGPVMIETLQTTTMSISPLGIAACLELVPYLKSLCVTRKERDPPYALEAGHEDFPPGDWMLDALHCRGCASPCPKLQLIVFEYCEFTITGFRALVAARQRLALQEAGAGRGFVPIRAAFLRIDGVKTVFTPRDHHYLDGLTDFTIQRILGFFGVSACIWFWDSFIG